MAKSPNYFSAHDPRCKAYRNRSSDRLVIERRELTSANLVTAAQKAQISEEQRSARGWKPKGVTLQQTLSREDALQLANDIFRWFGADPERWILAETEDEETTYIDCINEAHAVEMFDMAASMYPDNIYRVLVRRGYGPAERIL